MQAFDDLILEFFGNIQLPILNEIMIFVSVIGNSGIIWIALGLVLLCFKKTRKQGVTVLIALIISFLIGNLTIKPLVARQRPFEAQELDLLITPPLDRSFPSGHAMSSFAAACAVLFYDRRIGIPAVCLAALIAFSRLYLQVHYFSDVAAGVILGIIYAVIAYFIVKAIWKKADRNRIG